MKIKVCGMREAGNITALKALKPDYIGLIFYPQSKRFVDELDIGLLDNIPQDINITGVFVDENQDNIVEKARRFRFKALQLHGNETPQYCNTLREALNQISPDVELIKAFGLDEDFDFNVLEAYVQEVDFFLFDTKTPAHGGSGIKFNWELLKQYQLDKPYFLSGGISLENLEEIKSLNDERFYAVDLNSKFELSPGLKDIEQVSRAMDIIRSPLLP